MEPGRQAGKDTIVGIRAGRSGPSLRNVLAAIGLVLLLALPSGHSWPRTWKPTPLSLARDYTMITDTRPGDVRLVFWIASQTLSNAEAQKIFEDYVVIGVARMHISPAGNTSFDAADTLQASDGQGKPLKLLGDDDIAPAVRGSVTAVEALFRQSLGPLGQGFRWFVFAGGTVSACKPGGLSVPFAGETYTYETPIPGC